jgi:hypothetical protein
MALLLNICKPRETLLSTCCNFRLLQPRPRRALNTGQLRHGSQAIFALPRTILANVHAWKYIPSALRPVNAPVFRILFR